MQPHFSLPMQDTVLATPSTRPCPNEDTRGSACIAQPAAQISDESLVSHPSTKITGRLQVGSRQTSDSLEAGGSSRSSSSSPRVPLSGSSSGLLNPEMSTMKGGRGERPAIARQPESVASPSNLKPSLAGFNRRKIFGRSSSIRDMLGVSGGSSDQSTAHVTARSGDRNSLHHVQSDPEALPTISTKENPLGFLRHMGSRSFLNLSDSKRMSTSSDHLPLNSSELQGSKRLSESLKVFGRRRGRSVSKSLDAQHDSVSEFGHAHRNQRDTLLANSARPSGEGSESILSINCSERKQRSPDAQTSRESAPSETVDASAGLPKRFTGWLQNMVGNDSTVTSSDTPTLSPVKETESPQKASNQPAFATPGDLHSRETLHEAAIASSGIGSPQTANAPLSSSKVSVGTRAGALLQTLTSAPTKATKSQSTASANNGTGWASGGVGIDRAFRFFLESDADAKDEEGIWLLGVWHGPSSSSVGQETASLGMSTVQSSPGTSNLVDPGHPKVGINRDQVVMNATCPVETSSDSANALAVSTVPDRAFSQQNTPHSSQLAGSADLADTVRNIDSVGSPSSKTKLSRDSSNSIDAAFDWHATFQPDFSSRIWCTYRNHFAPITRDGTISEESASAAELLSTTATTQSDLANFNETVPGRSWLGRKPTESGTAADQPVPLPTVSPIGLGAALGASYATATSSLGDKMGINNLWGRATAAAQAAGFSRGLTTDAGWGCMLRTGQSLLANALMDVHLGRSWQKGSQPLRQPQLLEVLSSSQADQASKESRLAAWRQTRRQHATYVKILSWFLDDASPASPFSVHRMAREGKRLGKEVGEWFGPSTAAGAIKQLVSKFAEAGIGVVLDHDGVFHLNEVRATSMQRGDNASRRRPSTGWQRPVLILVGIRLGLESVNPIYYESVKATFSFPQSVGIAGGRPSSSYYFVGHQGNSLIYLDPHNVRPAVPVRFPPRTYPAAVPGHYDVAYRFEKQPQDDEEEWWAHVYSESQTSTYHCEKPRRMPIKSLDPSMLLGFLVKDEASLLDLCARIKALRKTIFSFADTAPTWVDDDDFDPSMESFSESSVGDGSAAEGDLHGTSSVAEADSGIFSSRELASFPALSAAELPSTGRDSNAIAKQRTAEWLGRGHSASTSSGPGIAFPTLSAQDFEAQHWPSRLESRLVSSSSATTARAGLPALGCGQLRDHTEDPANVDLPTPRVTGESRQVDDVLASVGCVAADDDSFSTMHLSVSEADSGWEEVSEVGTVAPSASAAAVSQLVLGESAHKSEHTSAGQKSIRPLRLSDGEDALNHSVLMERPSTTRAATGSPDLLIDDMVAINLDTPMTEAPQVEADTSDRGEQARVSMELGSIGTHTPTRREPPGISAGGYFNFT